MEPRHSLVAAAEPYRPPTATSKGRRRRHPPSARSRPPSQDRLVMVFVTASAIFFLISISPFLFGNFPSHGTDELARMHKHGDGQGGVLHLAGDKALLAWHYLMGQKRQRAAESNENTHYQPIKNTSNDGEPQSLARGVSGLPLSQTPALVGAKHGSIQCPSTSAGGESIRVDELAYWNEPQGDTDQSFVSPFDPQSSETRYVTFEPDRGGWNNIRMSLEIVIVFAAATGRTLVLPPDTPFYLLTKNTGPKKSSRHHGFADFLDLESVGLRKKVPMITMKEFLEREGTKVGDSNSAEKMLSIPGGSEGEKIWRSAEQCLYVAKSDRPCEMIYGFLRSQGYVPELQAGRECLIFDSDMQRSKGEYTDSDLLGLMPEAERKKVERFCDRRTPIFFGGELASVPIIHFQAGEKTHRLLNHFYTFLYFTDGKCLCCSCCFVLGV